MVGAVGIELRVVLRTRKLLIVRNARNEKNVTFAQVRYTVGTQVDRKLEIVNERERFNRPKSLVSFVTEKGSGSTVQTSYDPLRRVWGQNNP